MAHMGEHRSSMLDAPLRRRSDPSLSRDPRVRAVVAQLKALPAPQLRADFRDELRAQLVAITPRLVAEGAPAEAPLAGRADTAAGRAGRRRRPGHAAGVVRGARHAGAGRRAGRFALPRVASIAASLVLVLTLLLSGALLLSRNALPGDALYGLKRGSERAQLAFDTTDAAKADDYLRFATTRIREVTELVKKSPTSAMGAGVHGVLAAGGIDAATADRIRAALAAADSDTEQGSQLLTGQAVADRQREPLNKLSRWATTQSADILKVWKVAPTTALRVRMEVSLQIVTNAGNRSRQVLHALISPCLKTAERDEYGPKPCVASSPSGGSASTPAHGQPSATTQPGATRSPTSGRTTSPSRPGGGGGTGGTGTGTAANSGRSTGGGSRPSSSTASPKAGGRPSSSVKGGITVPTVPKPYPPVSVGSCSVSITAGPIGIGVPLCPTP
jgi:hypothetical protein